MPPRATTSSLASAPRSLATLLLAGLLLLASACASAPPRAPYPHESILTVIAELKIHLNKDPYRDPPGRDLQGNNIFRVSLTRLKSLESMTSGDYADVLAFAEGECEERLGAWAAAHDAFDRAAARGTSLAEEARRRSALAQRMAETAGRDGFAHTLQGYLNDLTVADRRLALWMNEKPGTPYESFIKLERERALAETARLNFTNRMVLPDALKNALDAAKQVAAEYPDGYERCAHLLALGTMYETLARDYAEEHPPSGADFQADGPWSGWIAEARAAYNKVAETDGDPAKLEGQARLRALETYALRIQALAR